MKKLLFLCMLICATRISAQISAQTIYGNPAIARSGSKQADSILRSKNNFYKSIPDTGIDKDILPYNGMPNAIRRKTPPDVYVGNNGQGQDIYRSQLDNMPILKADSTFQSGMPNASAKMKLYMIPVNPDPKIPSRVWTQPKNGSKTPNKK